MSIRTRVGANDSVLQTMGKFGGRLSRNGVVIHEDVYVVSGQKRSLLSRRVCESLDLVRRVVVDSVDAADVYRRNNPKLFGGFGKMKGEYEIKLRSDAKPFALTTLGRVSIPLLGVVRKELQRMEDIDVIRRVESPTDWCAGMAVVAKPKAVPSSDVEGQRETHKVHICVDLTKLNESVR